MMNSQAIKTALVLVICSLSLSIPSLCAVSLKSSVYMALPWGSQPGQAGRFIPSLKGDGYPAGPIGFALDSQGNLYLADMFNHRIQRVDRDTLQAHVIQSFEKDDSLAGVDVLDGKLYVIGDFGKAGKDRASKLMVCGMNGEFPKEFNLNLLGIQSPQDIQMQDTQHLLISDNRSLKSARLEPSWRIVETVEDKKLFWLRSKGRYRFILSHNKTMVNSLDGKKLTDYEGTIEVIGVDSQESLYMLYEKASASDQAPDVWLVGLSPNSQAKFQVHVTEKKDALLLDPKRFWEIRVARMGSDNAIYVMGDPEDDQFKIYRFDMEQ